MTLNDNTLIVMLSLLEQVLNRSWLSARIGRQGLSKVLGRILGVIPLNALVAVVVVVVVVVVLTIVVVANLVVVASAASTVLDPIDVGVVKSGDEETETGQGDKACDNSPRGEQCSKRGHDHLDRRERCDTV